MGKPSLSAVARATALGLVVLLLCGTLTVLLVGLRLSRDIRSQLQAVDEQLVRLSQNTRLDMGSLASGMGELSARLTDFSRATRKDIGSVGRSTRADVSLLQERLAGRLDEMAQRTQTQTETPTRFAPPAPSGPAEPARPALAPPLPQSPAAMTTLSSSSPEEEDLAAVRQAELAAALFDSGKYDLAQKAFARILAGWPQNTNARLYFAASLYRANPADSTRYAQIEKNLRAVLEGDSRSALALDTLSMLELESGKWPDALDHLRQLAVLQPENARHQKSAGYCAFKIGDLAAARNYFAEAVRLSPRDSSALTSLGDCEWALGNAADANASWTAALTVVDQQSPAGARSSEALRQKLARSPEAVGAGEAVGASGAGAEEAAR
jgi:tetratricopeptide (TPR) repeat protein